jgi:2-isopropylmalate synthase
VDLEKHPEAVDKIIHQVKAMENQGYHFEGAEASFYLLVARLVRPFKPFFDLKGFRVIVEEDKDQGGLVAEATLKVVWMGKPNTAWPRGPGPSMPWTKRLRRALEKFYPN